MRAAVLSESSADEAAVRILADGLLGRKTQQIVSPPLRTRGWPSALQVVPSLLKHLYYRTDAEAFVLVVDSNRSPVHQNAHDQPGGADQQCRLCRLRESVARVQSQLRPISGRPAIKTAIGLAVPSIEAWYRCGVDPHVNEATWILGLRTGSCSHTRSSLKQDVYGTDRPSLEMETKFAVEAARRLVQDLAQLERLFPNGFGSLARDVRNW